ncbi:MAG: uroporphyrinogen decarboxylase family protein [Promethearchaeota archaeon]
MELSGKDLLISTFNHESSGCVPWVPFAGIHAGKLKGYTARDMLKNEDHLLECLIAVNRQYFPDGQPVLFDLQVEAEILGCKLRWVDKAPPLIETHPLSVSADIPKILPKPDDGRLPMILRVMRKYKAHVRDKIALFGLIAGPLTLSSHLRGTRLFIDMIKNKEYTDELFDYTKHIAEVVIDYYTGAGMDVVAIVDPVISQISPRAFKTQLLNHFTELFKYIKEKDVLSAFFVCGDATKNIEPMCLSKPDSIFVDENVDMVSAKKITGRHNIVLGGNIPLTSVMLYGTQQDNMKYVLDLLDNLGYQDLVIAPGCDIPYDVPPENVIGVAQAVHEPEKVRLALKNYQYSATEMDLDLPDYNNLPKPLIEVFTIDSSSCAACGYMRNVAFTAREKFGNKIDLVEYKCIVRENIVRANKLGIKHLPCILINGKLKYSSIIPSQEDYFREIEKVLAER